jgi:transposase
VWRVEHLAHGLDAHVAVLHPRRLVDVIHGGEQGRLTMVRAIALRTDLDAAELRHLARRSKHAGQARRLLALAAIYDWGACSETARLGKVTLQTLRDWVVRFNAGGPGALVNCKAPGPTPLLTDAHRQTLAAQIDNGPIPAIHGVARWRLVQVPDVVTCG